MKDNLHGTNLENVHQESPWNAEGTLIELLDHNVTPYSLLYARNHSESIPPILESEYGIKIGGLLDAEREICLTDLKAMPRVSMEVAMQCAGLRRDEMNAIKQTEGVAWSSCAISNCSYTGVLLSVLLREMGLSIQKDARFVHFESHAVPCSDDKFYGSSVSIELIDRNDLLLAYEMNGEPLPQSHGGPCRVVIPGVYGARSVKWVDTIAFSLVENPCFYQQRDYKILPEHVTSQEQAKDQNIWNKVDSMTEIVPESTIVKSSTPGRYRGYALSKAVIAKVEVSFDDKRTWLEAPLIYQSGQWSWTLFEIEKRESMAAEYVYSRATDIEGNTQPEKPVWNLRGVGYNAYGCCRA